MTLNKVLQERIPKRFFFFKIIYLTVFLSLFIFLEFEMNEIRKTCGGDCIVIKILIISLVGV